VRTAVQTQAPSQKKLSSNPAQSNNIFSEPHPASFLLRLQRTLGNQAVQRLQTKLAISTPGDIYEKEADRVADQVMRMPDAEAAGLSGATGEKLQKKCAPCADGEGLCPPCAAEETLSMKRETADHAGPSTAPPIVHESLHSAGRPLDPATRAFMEPRFGQDFSQVRVHADAKAAESSRAINALAYTIGRDMVFGAGFYSPQTTSGRPLLAHALAHVVQQGYSGRQVQRQVAAPEMGSGAMPAGEEKCYPCSVANGVGVCCYAANAPMIPECFDLATKIIDDCGGSEACIRKAKCAQCKCIARVAGEEYCSCSGII
jgi:hypothetical protein